LKWIAKALKSAMQNSSAICPKRNNPPPPEKFGMGGWWRFLNWEENGIVSKSFTELKELRER
jgi:hypothetical protein